MKLKRKQLYFLGGIALLGIGSYFLLRRKKVTFFDNVWCSDMECSNIEDAVEYCSGITIDTDGDGIPDSGGRTIPNSSKFDPNKPGVTASCINEQNTISEQEAIFDAQVANGLIDEDGNPLRAGKNPIPGKNPRKTGRDWGEEYTTGNLNLIFAEPHGLNKGDKIWVQQDETAETLSSYNSLKIL